MKYLIETSKGSRRFGTLEQALRALSQKGRAELRYAGNKERWQRWLLKGERVVSSWTPTKGKSAGETHFVRVTPVRE